VTGTKLSQTKRGDGLRLATQNALNATAKSVAQPTSRVS
jgi:hypothetical protein